MSAGGIKIDHSHKIVKIIRHKQWRFRHLYELEMDCPVMPHKIVITAAPIKEGEIFDPHFSNPVVIVRLRPTSEGWADGLQLLK